jgi:DNA-binding response OmpR family regulator
MLAVKHNSRRRPVFLAVEDDEGLRGAVAYVLAASGYDVIVASSGEEALEKIAAHSTMDGLYTEIQLNDRVSGWKVGEAFHRKWPTASIAYASARTWPVSRMMPTGVFLRKPFLLEDLLDALVAG